MSKKPVTDNTGRIADTEAGASKARSRHGAQEPGCADPNADHRLIFGDVLVVARFWLDDVLLRRRQIAFPQSGVKDVGEKHTARGQNAIGLRERRFVLGKIVKEQATVVAAKRGAP